MSNHEAYPTRLLIGGRDDGSRNGYNVGGAYNRLTTDTELEPTHYMGADGQVYKNIAREGKPETDWNGFLRQVTRRSGPVAAVIAMSTIDGGEAETRYAQDLMAAHPYNVVAAASKGIISRRSNWSAVRFASGDLACFDPDATVGGLAPVLPVLVANTDSVERRRQLQSFAFNPNGTITYMLSEAAKGVDVEVANAKAKQLGLAEPGDGDAMATIAGEIGDMDKKAAGVINVGRLRGGGIDDTDIAVPVSGNDIEYVLGHPSDYQNVIAVVPGSEGEWFSPERSTLIGGKVVQLNGGLVLVKGFVRVRGSDVPESVAGLAGIQGPNSRIVIRRDIIGEEVKAETEKPGAGRAATAEALRAGMRRMMARQPFTSLRD